MSKLTKEDYDFADVPECELLGCLYYEYMRESKAILREASKARRQVLDEMKRRNTKVGDVFSLNLNLTKVTQNQGILFEGTMIAILAGGKHFPRVPWQTLSSSVKERLRNFPQRATEIHNENFRREHPMLVFASSLKEPSLGESTLNTWKAKMTPKRYLKFASAVEKLLISGFFQINMGYTQQQLCLAFSDWLKANHPNKEAKLPERRGRNTLRDRLNALGALRLRYYCKTFTEAQMKMKPLRDKPDGMFYADRRSFNRACAATVRHFQTLLKLSEKHLPIHFTKGWQK